MKLIEILGLYKAIKCTAKKYHWKTAGDNFMSDHLLFDRIYDDISDDSIDSIAEQYYMGLGRKDINDVDQLCELCTKYEGKSLNLPSSMIFIKFSLILVSSTTSWIVFFCSSLVDFNRFPNSLITLSITTS